MCTFSFEEASIIHITQMSHPVHQATENSPFGDLTKEEFYEKHNVLRHEGFMLNSRNMRIYTQIWRPNSPAPLKGLVSMVHGYTAESSTLLQLTAVAIAKLGFYVCALDLPGHGYSDGLRGHIPDIRLVVDDCIQFFDSVRANHPKLPAFLYGESLGGAISILICTRQKAEWSGLVLNGAMCGVSAKFKPAWPLQMLLPVAAFFMPRWRVVKTKRLASRSFKEEWKRKLVAKSPNRPVSSRPTTSTALEFLRVCREVERRGSELDIPILLVHGEDDSVCDPDSVRRVYEKIARSVDKTMKIFPGMWHMLIGETKEGVELVYGTIFSWLLHQVARQG